MRADLILAILSLSVCTALSMKTTLTGAQQKTYQQRYKGATLTRIIRVLEGIITKAESRRRPNIVAAILMQDELQGWALEQNRKVDEQFQMMVIQILVTIGRQIIEIKADNNNIRIKSGNKAACTYPKTPISPHPSIFPLLAVDTLSFDWLLPSPREPTIAEQSSPRIVPPQPPNAPTRQSAPCVMPPQLPDTPSNLRDDNGKIHGTSSSVEGNREVFTYPEAIEEEGGIRYVVRPRHIVPTGYVPHTGQGGVRKAQATANSPTAMVSKPVGPAKNSPEPYQTKKVTLGNNWNVADSAGLNIAGPNLHISGGETAHLRATVKSNIKKSKTMSAQFNTK
ncbi:hypothetical protein B0H13DRAFT_1880534 [Mycena leptocephala]|nr:hypothetical protein B0H13DRAFT_1880534 [Mycena leptocephala]